MSHFLTPLMLRAYTPEENRAAGRRGTGLYQVVEDLIYESDEFGQVVIPAGFITDFASIPTAARFWLDDDAICILYPSVLHDGLYNLLGVTSDRVFTRQEADTVLREAMIACGARKTQAAVVYSAVRLFGGSHWKSD